MEDVIRIGFVSSRSLEQGMVQVTYPDRDRMVTEPFPVLCFGNEFCIPEINDQVLVLHLSGDLSSGVVIGKMWNDVDRPQDQGEWYKEIGNVVLSINQGQLKIHAPEIIFSCSAGDISISEIIGLRERVEALEARD